MIGGGQTGQTGPSFYLINPKHHKQEELKAEVIPDNGRSTGLIRLFDINRFSPSDKNVPQGQRSNGKTGPSGNWRKTERNSFLGMITSLNLTQLLPPLSFMITFLNRQKT